MENKMKTVFIVLVIYFVTLYGVKFLTETYNPK